MAEVKSHPIFETEINALLQYLAHKVYWAEADPLIQLLRDVVKRPMPELEKLEPQPPQVFRRKSPREDE